MATSYTTLLGLALPVQGELSGTWGDTVNDYITQYLDAAVAGTQTISGNLTAVTLSKTTNAALSQAGSGATGSSQYQIINCTGNPASELTVTVPAASKEYIVINATSTSQNVKIVGAGPTTGVTVVSGERCLIAWNGSDFVKIGGTNGAGSFTTLNVTGNSTLGDAVGDTVTVNGTATFVNANPTLSAGTANGVAYLNGSKVLTTGSALTFDGTSLTAGASAGAGQHIFRTYTSGGFAAIYNGGVTPGSTNYSVVTNATQTTLNAATFVSAEIGSSEQMRLTSTGLGIGTSSPDQKLAVAGRISISGSGYTVNSTNGLVGAYNGNMYLQMPSGGNLQIWKSTTDATATFDQSGNLGIGTSSPSTKLHLSDATNPTIRLQDTTYTGRYIDIAYNQNGVGEPDLVISRAVGGSPTTLATLDYSGNLGLGVTPSAWGTTKALEFSYGSFSANSSLGTDVAGNCYYNGTNWIYRVTGVALRYNQATAGHSWHVASGTAGNAISFTQAMTLDASGRLLVGTTSSGGANRKLQVSGQLAAVSGSVYTELDSDSGGTGYVGTQSNHPLAFKVNDTERARIDSSGNLLVGTTSLPTGSTGGAGFEVASNSRRILRIATTSTSVNNLVEFYNPNGAVGIISVSGSSTTYATSSDYRLKENIQPMTGALAKVQALKPCTYKWKADGSDGEGFIAHELAEVVPQCVTGEKDAVDAEGKPVYQGIDTSFLVATLTAAIQEQQAIITDLRARVAALEAA